MSNFDSDLDEFVELEEKVNLSDDDAPGSPAEIRKQIYGTNRKPEKSSKQREDSRNDDELYELYENVKKLHMQLMSKMEMVKIHELDLERKAKELKRDRRLLAHEKAKLESERILIPTTYSNSNDIYQNKYRALKDKFKEFKIKSKTEIEALQIVIRELQTENSKLKIQLVEKPKEITDSISHSQISMHSDDSNSIIETKALASHSINHEEIQENKDVTITDKVVESEIHIKTVEDEIQEKYENDQEIEITDNEEIKNSDSSEYFEIIDEQPKYNAVQIKQPLEIRNNIPKVNVSVIPPQNTGLKIPKTVVGDIYDNPDLSESFSNSQSQIQGPPTQVIKIDLEQLVSQSPKKETPKRAQRMHTKPKTFIPGKKSSLTKAIKAKDEEINTSPKIETSVTISNQNEYSPISSKQSTPTNQKQSFFDNSHDNTPKSVTIITPKKQNNSIKTKITKVPLHEDYDIDFEYDPGEILTEGRVINGKQIIHYKNGAVVTIFRNGTKKLRNDDLVFVYYPNGDIMQEFTDGAKAYQYADSKTIELSLPDQTMLLQFVNGQREKHFPNGDKAIQYPNGQFKISYTNGDYEMHSPDGRVETCVNGKITNHYEEI